MNESKTRALGLLRKAEEDLHIAVCFAKDAEASLWTLGFHAQQRVEESLEAVLMWHDITSPSDFDTERFLAWAKGTIDWTSLLLEKGLLEPE